MISGASGGSPNFIGFGPNGGINTDILNSPNVIQLIAAEGMAGSDGCQPFQNKAGIYRVPLGKKLRVFLLVSASGTAGLRFGLAYSNNSIARNAGSVPATAAYESGTNTIYMHRTIVGTQYEPVMFEFPSQSYPAIQGATTTAMSAAIFGVEVDE